MRLTRTGASSSARLAMRAGSAAVTARDRESGARAAATVPAMNSSVPPGRPCRRRRARPGASTRVLVDARRASRSPLGQRRVVQPAAVTMTWSTASAGPAKNCSSASASAASNAAVLRAPSSRAACSRRSGLRAVSIDVGALGAPRRAVSSPMPALPPMTTTVCPSSRGGPSFLQWLIRLGRSSRRRHGECPMPAMSRVPPEHSAFAPLDRRPSAQLRAADARKGSRTRVRVDF